jgi:hypothetical protein
VCKCFTASTPASVVKYKSRIHGQRKRDHEEPEPESAHTHLQSRRGSLSTEKEGVERERGGEERSTAVFLKKKSQGGRLFSTAQKSFPCFRHSGQWIFAISNSQFTRPVCPAGPLTKQGLDCKHMLQYVRHYRFVGYSTNIFRMGNDEKQTQVQCSVRPHGQI